MHVVFKRFECASHIQFEAMFESKLELSVECCLANRFFGSLYSDRFRTSGLNWSCLLSIYIF